MLTKSFVLRNCERLLSRNVQWMCRKITFIAVMALIMLSGDLSGLRGFAAPSGNIINTGIARDKTSLCALRDKYGFLWVGTMTGVGCFDGNGESVYGQSGVLPSTEGLIVNALFEKDDDIWLGGSKGLYVFHRFKNEVERFPYKTRYNVQISSTVEKIKEIADGRVWILTHGQGFFIYNPLDGSLIQNSRHGAFYSDMSAGDDGLVYAATHDGYLQVFKPEGELVCRMRLPGFVTDKNPISMSMSSGSVRLASNKSVYRYPLGGDKVEIELSDAGCGVISTIACSDDSRVWMGSDEGVFFYDVPDVKNVSDVKPVSVKDIDGESVLVDSRVVQFISDSHDGLIVVTRTGISFMPEEKSGIRKVMASGKRDYGVKVNDFCISPDGNKVWLATDHGVAVYDVATGVVENSGLDIGADIVVASIAHNDGKLWIGSRHQGLYLYDIATGSVKRYTYDEDIPYSVISNSINDICVSSKGEVFVLTNWGICRYDKGSDNFVVLTEMGSGIPFVDMVEDAKGRIWTLTATNDLYLRDVNAQWFYSLNNKEQGPYGMTLLHVDNKGEVWGVGADNKLFHFNETEKEFVEAGTPMLKGHPITFIEDGKDGEFWIANDECVVMFDSKEKSPRYSFLTDPEVLSVHGSSCRLESGTILFGTQRGLCELAPSRMETDRMEERAYLMSLSFPYSEDSDAELKRLGLDRLLYTVEDIELPYSDNTFTVHFACSRNADMPSVRYRYKLEGVDKAWMTAQGSQVTYNHLSPGTYRLLLRPDSGAEGSEKSVTIKILPPWYASWPAYILYAVVAMACVWAGLKIARRRVKRQADEHIREMQALNERETYESKMRFFVNLVHEIRTPLTLINLPLEQIADSIESNNLGEDEKKDLVRSMQRNLDYLLGIINQLLDFRKAEKDSEVRLSRHVADVAAIVRGICKRFEEPMKSQGKILRLNVPDVPVKANIDIDKFDRVVMNLLGNAMKYCRRQVEVTLAADGDKFSLDICDDGNGIDLKERDRIFDTYYQISGDDVGATLGTGLGLAYARLISKAHGGDITVDNNLDGGACFRLSLPVTIGRDAETENDEITDSDLTLPRETGGDSCSGQRLTLLFVEDNHELRTSMTKALGSKYEVVAVENGEQALTVLDENKDIDIIISDYMMPGIDGAEFCRQVKGNIETSYIPFIILTAKTGRDAKEAAMKSGADAFIEKPFSIKQLMWQVSNIVSTREQFYSKMQSGGSDSKDAPSNAPYLNKVDAEFLKTLNDYIMENIFDEEFSIDGMATEMSMSRSTLYRRIKAITGMSPVDYLKNFRLEHAGKLLKDGMRVQEVASMVGFTSSSYFAKCFRAKFGMIPKEYVASLSKD